jgi:hypothetical protein
MDSPRQGNRSSGLSTVHVDEASFSNFHYSAVLWLNPIPQPQRGSGATPQGENGSTSTFSFDGGEKGSGWSWRRPL